MRERTVTIGSAGKTFSFTGWKVGWVTAPPALVSAVRSAKQFLTYVASGPFQYAAATALALPDAYFSTLRTDLERKRDLLADGLTAAGFEVFRPDGTYFITTDISALTPKGGMDFCRELPERCGVVAIPNQVFYDDTEAARSPGPLRLLQEGRGTGRGRRAAGATEGVARALRAVRRQRKHSGSGRRAA